MYRNDASILAIHYRMVGFPHLSYIYNFETYDQIMKEINHLDSKKPIQQNDLPTKIVNENKDVT